MMVCGGISSSQLGCGWAYDVFLSFRGKDTRKSFTGFLYHALRQRGINVFIDDEKLRTGEEISPALLRAIEESMIAIIVFSENYASSTWCLDELVKILHCKQTRGQMVWPVFYNVDPSVVRHQRASFGIAMAKHEARLKDNIEKLQTWKWALFEAANLSGWSLENGYEFELIEMIVKQVSGKLDLTLLHISDYPVGLETRISEVKSLLHIGPCEDIRMVGIYGLGGIGKTTIVRALFNLIADQFECSCFLADVRETASQRQGLVQLQETMLYDLVGEKSTRLGNIYRGIPIIKKRLRGKKVLLILDDIDKLEQLQALAGGRGWFGFDSVIIITTRDKHLLAAHQVEKTYEVKKLTHDEAFELFTWNAFKRKSPDAGYTEISNRVVLYAEGLPLALKVMGSNLFGKTVDEWESAVDKYEKIPNREVQNVLRVSYDNLEENEKEIFLDIACFFKGEAMEYVEKTLKACGYYPKFGIGVLIDRSLITLDEYNRLRMHDLIQDMGREIVREDSPLEPGKRSRLWYHEDVFEVLTENTGSSRIQGMLVDLPGQYMIPLRDNTFQMMKNLKVLIVRNAQFFGSPQHLPNNLRLLDWMEYPSSSLPSNFHPRKLVVLNLSRSRLSLQEPLKYLDSLASMDLSHCEFLTKLPDISGVPNLMELNLDFCTNLVEVHDSVGFLQKLNELRAYGCTNLRVFPCAIKLTSLKSLTLNWCSSLQRFPDVLGEMENLISISIEGSGIEELPPSIGNLVGLQELSMTSCLSLKELPNSIDMLKNLRNLDIEGCPQLRNFLTQLKCMDQYRHAFDNIQSLNLENCGLLDEDLPIIFSCFPNLASLVLSGNNFIALPTCIQEYFELQLLHLDDCKELQEIPCLPPNLQYINARNCISLTAESSSLLLSQETLEGYGLQVVVPGTRTPEWFDHCSKGAYMTFWVRQNFPVITLCYVLAVETDMKKSLNCEVRFFINGDEIFELEMPWCFPQMVVDHVWLNDLRTHPSIQWQSLGLYLEDDWNQVEISCEAVTGAPNVTVSWCGIHVCRPEANKKDIRFTDPDLNIDDASVNSDKIDTDLEISSKKSAESMEDSQFQMRIEDNWHNYDDDIEGDETLGSQSPECREDISKHKGKTIMTCHFEVDTSQPMLLLHPQPLDSTQQPKAYSSKDYGPNKANAELVFQVTKIIEDQNIQATFNPIVTDIVAGEELHQNTSSTTLMSDIESPVDHISLTLDAAEMEAFYASLDTETPVLSPENARVSSELTAMPSEKTQRALKTLQDFLSKDFSVLLNPLEYSTMKTTLDYLSNLSMDDGISVEMRSLIIEVSREFTHWSWDYSNASSQIEFTTANLLKADELEEGLEANKKHFREVMFLENDLHNQLTYLEERKRELEEQINAIKANISASHSAKSMAIKRKSEIFEEGKMLKAQRDELRVQVPRMRDKGELAKKIQENIRAEWLKLGEKLNKSFNL